MNVNQMIYQTVILSVNNSLMHIHRKTLPKWSNLKQPAILFVCVKDVVCDYALFYETFWMNAK